MYCNKCGTQNPDDASFCGKCGNNLKSTKPEKKNSGIAAVLSLIIPGIGQIYCGRAERGIKILIGTIVLLYIYIYIGILLWVWTIYDAYQLAEKPVVKNKEEAENIKVLKQGLAVILILLMLLFVFVIIQGGTFKSSEPTTSQPEKSVLITAAPSQMLPTIDDMPDNTRKVSETVNETYAERKFVSNNIFTQLLIYRINKFPSIGEAIDNYNANKNKYSDYKLSSVNIGDEALGLEDANTGATIVFRKANVVVQVYLLSKYGGATLSEAIDYAKKVRV